MSRRAALTLVASNTTVPLQGEWLEAFWCTQCQETRWHHIHKVDDRVYEVQSASDELWQQASGVIHPDGNMSVSEYTRRHSRQILSGKLNLVNEFR